MEQNNKFSVIAKFYENKVRYFDGTLKAYLLEGVRVSLKEYSGNASNIPILVVAKQYYQETQKHYPTDDLATLKKILKLEASKNGGYFNIASISENGSRVNWWLFDEDVPKALVTIPETYLLAYNSPRNEVIELSGVETPIYIKSINGLIYSAFQSRILKDHERFLASIGALECSNSLQLNAQQTRQRIFDNLIKSKLKCFQIFLKRPSREELQRRLVPLSFLAVGMSCLYLALTSVYLVAQKHSLEEDLQEKRPFINEMLDEQNQYDDLVQFNDNVALVGGKVERVSFFWAVISDYFGDVSFTNVRKSGERFIIRGSSKKATDILERLSQHSFIQDAKFDFPTRTGRGVEVFVISFKLVEPKESFFLSQSSNLSSEDQDVK